MKWSMAQGDVGFDLEANPQKEFDAMKYQTRVLLIFLFIIFGLALPGLNLVRALRYQAQVDLGEPGLLLSEAPFDDAPISGSLRASGRQFSRCWLNDGEEFSGEGRASTTTPSALYAKSHKSRASHSAAQHAPKAEGDAAEAPAAHPKVKGSWVLLSSQPIRIESGDGLGTELYADGWARADAVQAKPFEWKDAFEDRKKLILASATFGFLCLIIGLFAPAAAVPAVRLWFHYVVEPLGWLNTRLLLGFVFFFFMAPYALYIRRVMGHDPLDRALNPDQQSYWKDKRDLKPEHFTHRF